LFCYSEYSPKNPASSAPIASLSISPHLSLQPEMHNSPSSCGQSSSEGLTDAIGQSKLGLLQTQRQQSAEISVASILSAAYQQLVGFVYKNLFGFKSRKIYHKTYFTTNFE
jgi:hypothetical protein